MKSPRLLLCLLLPFLLNAQTLTQSKNEPVSGDSQLNVILDTSNFSTGMPVAITGTNKVFDYTKLKNAGNTYPTNYIAASSVTEAVNYPGCTLVQNETGLMTFLKSSTSPTTQTEVLGILSGSAVSLSFNNPAIAIIYPFSYGSSCTDNMAGTFTLGTLNGNCSGKITVTADATGTLNLPDGFVHNNVIRIKSMQTLTATQGLFPLGTLKQTLISYYNGSDRFPILTLDYSTFTPILGTATVSAFVKGDRSSFVVGITEENSPIQVLSIYPNPANDHILINSGARESESGTISIYSLLGEKMKEQETDSGGKTSISVSDLPTGVYQVILKTSRHTRVCKMIKSGD